MMEKSEMLELYSVYAQTVTANEQRRQALSAFYTSLIAIGVVLLSSDNNYDRVWIISALFVVSVIWYFTIRYFRRLAKAKFEVIKLMESHFAVQPFGLEWKFFKGELPGNVETPKKKRRWVQISLTHFDMAIPLIMLVSCGAYLLYRLFGQ